MSKKRTVLGIFLMCLLILISLAFFGVRRTRVGTVQGLVSQNVKTGESSRQVISFLDAQHLEHSELMKPQFMSLGGREYGNRNVIVAIKRNTWVSILQEESVQLVFVFDDNDQLVGFDVSTVYTGL